MTRSYRTVARSAETDIEVKRSVFRCHVEHVSDEAAARAVVERARSVHWDARHHCSAFILGPAGQTARSSDDGEPAGTAGAPMLEVLRGHELTDVVAVVTRWFGGTLLGAGGLVRAYSDAVRAGLAEAGVRRRELRAEFTLDLDHAVAGRVESELRSRGYAILDTSYAAFVTLRLGVPQDATEALTTAVAELTGGATEPRAVGESWVDAHD
ncbi:YigZ family protein [Granulicoccus sp. GXG6511]|uniref:YigZ family protein n=1 Tax=Granulicoccus sp. GXG6511 TaxID=3381351 RepID=UPI003D7F1375